MASANDGDRAAAGLLQLLLGMSMGPSAPMPQPQGGVMMVHHFIFGGDGDLFSGGVGGGVPPASKAAIASLKEVQLAAAEGGCSLGECAICLDSFEAGKEMPCGHRFHGECLERWLGVHGSCPVCRRELPPAEAAEEQNDGTAAGGESRRPRSAVVVSYYVMGGEQRPREEPWTVRIEGVD